MSLMTQLEERIAGWVAKQDDIRAAVVVGSRARHDRPADRWSDLDIVLLVRDPDRFLSRSAWLDQIDPFWVTFIESTAAGGGQERRVLFEGGLDVDFATFPQRRFQLLLYAVLLQQKLPAAARLLPRGLRRQADEAIEELAPILRRGYRILLDRDHVFARLVTALTAEPPRSLRPPTAAEFAQVTGDFWYHAVWAARKLRRGELWVAKMSCDSYMKWLLLRMLRWHTGATHGWTYDTWHEGRFLEEWADPPWIEALRGAFAHYERDDVERALLVTMALFRQLTTETAERLQLPYPRVADEKTTALVMEALKGDI